MPKSSNKNLKNDALHGASFERSPAIGPFSLLVAFSIVIAALGGSSRADPIQLVALRPLATLFLIPALYLLDWRSWKQAATLIYIFGAFMMWTGMQLLPLPPSLWQALPDREVIAELDRLTGVGDQWRPLSLAPTRGMNALLSLLVPFSALLLAVASKATSRIILHVVLGIGLINAAVGFIQIVTGPDSPLYLYMYVAPRSAAGLFANENHSTVFSALMLVIIARLAAERILSGTRGPDWTRIAYPTSYVFILLTVLVTGSRAGLAALVIALGASAVIAWQFARPRGAFEHKPQRAADASASGILTATFGLFAIGLALTFVLYERTPAMQAILDENAFDDLRWKIFPLLATLTMKHWLFGTGFGSFEILYQSYEPTDLLMVAYVNHAHNDWLQLAIEGGVPACAIIGLLFAWVIRSLTSLRCLETPGLSAVIATQWAASLLIIGAASAVDYPLRTPIFQVVAVWALVSLMRDRKRLTPV